MYATRSKQGYDAAAPVAMALARPKSVWLEWLQRSNDHSGRGCVGCELRTFEPGAGDRCSRLLAAVCEQATFPGVDGSRRHPMSKPAGSGGPAAPDEGKVIAQGAAGQRHLGGPAGQEATGGSKKKAQI